MDFHDLLKIAGGVGALALFFPMAVQVIRDGGGQSFATWILWAMLDTILAISTMVQRGNFLLPLGFAAGGWVLTALLLVRKRFAWNRLDSLILALVLACLIVWAESGARTAIIAATLAICAAGIPGLIELWRNPQRAVGNIWAAYTVANLLAFFGGRAMTVPERFAPALFALLSLLMAAVSRRRPSR